MAQPEKIWLVNRGEYAIHDHSPESNTRFEPGEPKRAVYTTWAKAQPTLEVTTDPNGDATEKEQAKAAAANAAAEAERAEQTKAAEAAQAAARGEKPEAAPKA